MTPAPDPHAAYHRGFLAAADELEKPYPEDVFTPMTEDEVSAAVKAMNEVVRYASERMHASWARHWAGVLRESAKEIEPRGSVGERLWWK